MSYEVELKHIEKYFGSFKAADDASFGVEKGQLAGLLGPSGSGKTTLLRMLAGLEQPDKGDIWIAGRRVNKIPARERGIGFVFQNYALFRHMTVRDNLAFGLRVQKVDDHVIKVRTDELLELTGLAAVAKRYPQQLSGGQRQRVAFARALAPNPKVLLLDEPFAAIDAKVRKELRSWLREAIHNLGITSLFVTHDQDEAVEVADKIIIVNKGRIEQAGSPVEIYQSPQTPFVADFIGESVKVEDYTQFKGFGDEKVQAGTQQGTHARMGIIRPEFIELAKDEREISLPLGAEQGVVKATYFRGSSMAVDIEVRGQILRAARSLEKEPLQVGDKALAFIHRIYSLDAGQTRIIENRAKRQESVVI
ncbi:MAG: sulfate ABC transporter ATP-binding protein [Selenomonas ruminantium]|jgi:sulfate transport system ATP-binding protein|uniref:ABC-type quaternary amine transporter n=1 Tax=Selenomonas ruminantium TaxID=971 RepID=A0A927ZY25_SELRU|nr:sulfate ABC transporter ATP-binding protein [Selenomonas ruminantium]